MPQVLTPLVKKQAPALGYPPVACLEEWARLLPPIFQKNTPHFWGKSLRLFFFKKKRISVRGVAKNSVDHKHGGKGRGGVLRNF